MRLKSTKLTNFRGFQEATVIPIDESMTGIVGRNEYGESTMLEALAICFEIDGANLLLGDADPIEPKGRIQYPFRFNNYPSAATVSALFEPLNIFLTNSLYRFFKSGLGLGLKRSVGA